MHTYGQVGFSQKGQTLTTFCNVFVASRAHMFAHFDYFAIFRLHVLTILHMRRALGVTRQLAAAKTQFLPILHHFIY